MPTGLALVTSELPLNSGGNTYQRGRQEGEVNYQYKRFHSLGVDSDLPAGSIPLDKAACARDFFWYK